MAETPQSASPARGAVREPAKRVSPFQRLEPGETPPPPPAELSQWTSQVLSGLGCGMMYGGYRGLVEGRSPRGELDPPPGEPSPFASHKHRAAAYFARGSIIHGARIGSFVALVSGGTLICDAWLGTRGQGSMVADPRSVAAASGGTCFLFGGAMAGPRIAFGAGLFGVLVGGAAGLLHRTVDATLSPSVGELAADTAMAADKVPDAVPDAGEGGRQMVADVVRWLEEGKELRKRMESESPGDSTSESS